MRSPFPESREKAFFWSTQSKENELWYQHKEIGYNYRMSNVVAGIGRGQLKHIEEHKRLKEKIFRKYDESFKSLPVHMNPYIPDSKPNFWLSCLLFNRECKIKPIELIKWLNDFNIEARPIWKPMHIQPLYRNNDFISIEEKAVSEDIFDRGICLPSDIKMTESEQDYVIDTIKSYFEQMG